MFKNTDTIEYFGSGHSGVLNRLLSESVTVLSAQSEKKKLILRTYSRDRQKIIVLFDSLCYNYKIIKSTGTRAMRAFFRKRWLLPISVAAVVIMLSLIPRFIYDVRVEGADKDAILYVIEQQGVKRGAFIGKVDFDEARREVEKLDGVAFVDIVVKGSVVTVSVQRELPPVNIIDVSAVGKIVSGYDAVLSRQLIFSGEGLYKKGDIVRAGDVLISSEIPIGDQTVTVYPSGEVYGLVTYKASVLFTDTRIERVKSGNSFTESVTEILGLVGKKQGSPYKMYETRVVTEKSGFLIPMTVKRITYYEIVDKEVTETFEQAEEKLKSQALSYAQGAIPDGAVVKNRITTVRHTGAGVVVEAVITAEQRIDVPQT